jgi:hypothetical protein
MPRKRGTGGRKIKNAASRLVQFDVNPFAISRNSRKFASKKREKSGKIELNRPKIAEKGENLHARTSPNHPYRKTSQNENSDSLPPFRWLNQRPEWRFFLSPFCPKMAAMTSFSESDLRSP